ncbi:hypothetical protein BDQ17DRAFT_1347490 [Cyathus striatus]|nr:hypothetical protein BDQ17DRAFT_1347490 [Cyathus striatus]
MSFTLTSTSHRRHINDRTAAVLLTPSKKQKISSDKAISLDIWSWTLTADSVASCFVRDALEMKENTEEGCDFFWLGRVPCRSVTVFGIVIGLQVYEKRVVYSIDDGTSVIDCTHQQSIRSSPKKQTSKSQKPVSLQPPELPKPVAFIGHFVRVTGRVQRKHETRQIVVSDIERCNPNDELHHYQEHKPTEHPTPSNIATPSSVFSSPTKSEVSHTSPPQKSPQKLRHPSRLHSCELTDNTFRIYLKHYMDNAPDVALSSGADSGYDTDTLIGSSLDQAPSTPTKQRRYGMDSTPRMSHKHCADQTPRPCITPLSFGPSSKSFGTAQKAPIRYDGTPRGFTLSYLRRVPELREMARRVVLAEAKKRLREERKKMKQARSSESRSQKRSSSSVPMDRDKLALKMKRLFTWAVVQLLKDGGIILWDGPHRPPLDDETPSQSILWKANASGNSTMATESSCFSSVSGPSLAEAVFFDDGDLSDPQPNEEVYMPLKPAILADNKPGLLKLLPEPEPGCTKQQILSSLRRDDRWRYVGEWNIDDALDLLNREGRVWYIGDGRWELTL